MGIPNKGREGLGLNPKRYWSKALSIKERGTMIAEKISREAEEERRKVMKTELFKQEAQTKWEVPEKKITKGEMINTLENQFRFWRINFD